MILAMMSDLAQIFDDLIWASCIVIVVYLVCQAAHIIYKAINASLP